MKIKYIVILLICVFMAGCNKEQLDNQDKGNSYTIYLLENNKFNTRQYYTHTEKTVDIVKELFKEMGIYSSSSSEKNYVKNINIANKVAYVYFNNIYSEMDNVYEVLFRASIVRTVTQLEGIDYLYFYIEDTPLTYNDGQIVGLMSNSDFLSDSDSEFNDMTWETLVLYFGDEDMRLLKRKVVDVAFDRSVSLERVVVEQLIEGPGEEGYVATLAPKVKILKTRVNNGTCYVNFDNSILNETHPVNFELACYSIVNSLCELTNINKVQFQVNGDSHLVVNGVDFDKVYERNLDIIK